MDTLHSIHVVLAIVGFVFSSLILMFVGSVFALLFTRRGEPYRQVWPFALFSLALVLVLWAKSVRDIFPQPFAVYLSLSVSGMAVVLLYLSLIQAIRIWRRRA